MRTVDGALIVQCGQFGCCWAMAVLMPDRWEKTDGLLTVAGGCRRHRLRFRTRCRTQDARWIYGPVAGKATDVMAIFDTPDDCAMCAKLVAGLTSVR